jgi:hypothetical protein
MVHYVKEYPNMVYTILSLQLVSNHEDWYMVKGTRTHVGGGEEPGTFSYSMRLDE